LVHGVNFSMFTQFITEEGEFVPNELSHKSAEKMFIELIRWTKGLQVVKENK